MRSTQVFTRVYPYGYREYALELPKQLAKSSRYHVHDQHKLLTTKLPLFVRLITSQQDKHAPLVRAQNNQPFCWNSRSTSV